MATRQSDLRRRGALTGGRLVAPPRQAARGGTSAESQHSDIQVSNGLYWRLEHRVDAEIDTLARSTLAMTFGAEVRDQDAFSAGQQAYDAQSRTESMGRAVRNLHTVSHILKMLLLVNDESEKLGKDESQMKETLAVELGNLKEQAGLDSQVLCTISHM